MIEPVGVAPREDLFLLLIGRRRYEAVLKLGLETIPARIFPDIRTKEQILTLQLTENVHRKDLDPIDMANGVHAFFQCRHGDKFADPEAVISALMNYDRDPERVEKEFTATVAVILDYLEKSTRSIENILSLLKLPEEIKIAVKSGLVSQSQGYIFAENLDNPGLMTVFNTILKDPVTNEQLKAALKKAGAKGRARAGRPVNLFQPVYTAAVRVTDTLTSGEIIDLIEIDNLILCLTSMLEVAKRARAGGGTAKEPEPPPSPSGKKRPVA